MENYKLAHRQICQTKTSLEEIRTKTPHESKDTREVVDVILDPLGNEIIGHWENTAGSLLGGLILYILYMRPEKSLSEVAKIINGPNIGNTLEQMATERHTSDEILIELYGKADNGRHPIIYNCLLQCANKPKHELVRIIYTATSKLTRYFEISQQASQTRNRS